MHISEQQSNLTFQQWLRRAANLPIRELIRRVMNLLRSFFGNVIAIRKIRQNLKPHEAIHFIILTERMGDIIAAGPTLRQIKKPRDYVIWLVRPQFKSLLDFHPDIKYVMPVSSYTETIILRFVYKNCSWTNFHIENTSCNIFGITVKNKTLSGITLDNYYLNGPLVDVYSLIGTNKRSDMLPVVYPDPNFDPKGFITTLFPETDQPLVIIHSTSDDPSRSWESENTQKLANWLLNQSKVNIIEVGLTPVLTANTRTFLLRDKLPISQQIAVMASASLFIGVDSGFAHIANALKINMIVLIGIYRNFTYHLPWYLQPTDIVLRSKEQAKDVPVEQVVRSASKLLNLGT